MIIPIKRDGNLDDWAIIELQGNIHFDSTNSEDDQYIGDLHFTKLGKPIFIVGRHVLIGEEVKLPKPFVILEKVHNDSALLKEDSDVKTEYVIKAVVRKKLLFRTRPAIIAANI